MVSRRSAALVVLAIVCGTPLFAQGLPITITKSFNPASVPAGGTATTTMTVTITNPNTFQVTGINLSDTYPAGLAPDIVGAYTCGTLGSSALFNASGWSFTNVTLAAGASCSVPMGMHATIQGAIVNTTSQVTGTGVPPGGPASATLNVSGVIVPTLSGWMLLVLALAISIVAVIRLRTQASQQT